MPHQCTNCDRTYEDGSQSVLDGCEDCGGTTFQYFPASAEDETENGGEVNTESDSDASADDTPLGGGLIRVGDDDDQSSSETTPDDSVDTPRDNPAPKETGSLHGQPDSPVDADVIRKELNRQFEGIHIVSPGHYELNLMELYKREECVITLRGDGRYEISAPGEADADFSLE